MKDFENIRGLKDLAFEYEMALYDSIAMLSEAKTKIKNLKKFSIGNIRDFLLDKSAETEKNAQNRYNSEKELYDEARVCLGEIRNDMKLMADYEQIPEYTEYTYEQKISALKDKEKELDDLMNLGRKLIEISNELMKKTEKADLYLRFRHTSKRHLKEDASPPPNMLLYTIIFGESDKNKILGKVYRSVSNMSPLMKSFAEKLNKINKNRLHFVKTANLKNRDISVAFLDYFYLAVTDDMKERKDLSDDYRILDGLCEKIGKITSEAFGVKEAIVKNLDQLYKNYRNNNNIQIREENK